MHSQRSYGVKNEGDLEQILQVVGIGFHHQFTGVFHLLDHADQLVGVLRIGGISGLLQRMRRLLRAAGGSHVGVARVIGQQLDVVGNRLNVRAINPEPRLIFFAAPCSNSVVVISVTGPSQLPPALMPNRL